MNPSMYRCTYVTVEVKIKDTIRYSFYKIVKLRPEFKFLVKIEMDFLKS